MADRFPSLEDFDSGHVDQSTNNKSGGDDLDFFARERALLGDDAAEFASPSDNVASATVEELEDDLLGGGGNYGSRNTAEQDVTEFESSFPRIDTGISPGGNINSLDSISQPVRTPSYGKVEEEEPEPMRQWRIRRDQDIERRAKISAEKKDATIKAAKKWTDDFYEGYNRNKDKSIARSRKEAAEYVESREDTTAGGTSWERVAKLVDLSGKGARGGAAGTGKEKFKELLMGLKADKQAPGAGGYASTL